MMLNEDYKDILQIFIDERVKFLLIGAYALAAYGYPRATLDIDLWVMPSMENGEAVLRSLKRFGAPLGDLSSTDFSQNEIVFQIGIAPCRIDIITGVDGLDFENAFKQSQTVEIAGISIPVVSMGDLVKNKKSTGRLKDLADVEVLENLIKARNTKP